MAGGQGTRLGSDLPKGQYDVGLPSHKSLFQLQAERIGTLQNLAHKAHPHHKQVVIPWYIMTSPMTEEKTKLFFAEKRYFGLDAKNVVFFNQEDMPAITPDGKLILEDVDRISKAPNGNGAIFSALNKTGCLADMAARGVEQVFVYGVDNILVRIADPVFVGFCHEQKADCGTKVVPKAYPEEPVGVLALKDGRPHVVEYSELPAEVATKKNAQGELLFNGGNIAMHLFSLKFLRAIVDQHLKDAKLGWHIAKKKIPSVNDKGEKVTPKEPNGWKFELFVFDVFPLAENMVALEVVRGEEFSPLKNAEGNKSDSPNTCRSDITRLHSQWISAAGGKVAGEGLCEVSSLLSYAGEGLDALVAGKEFQPPVELK